MASHRVLVLTQRPDYGFWDQGDLVDYDGEPDWKFQPLDPDARKAWEAEIACPDRVEAENRRHNIGGCFKEGESPFPTGVDSRQTKQFPPSGWQG